MPIEYKIRYTKAAEKFFCNHEHIRDQYKNAIHNLLTGQNPEQIDCKKLKGKKGDYYRIRIGRYRVVYTVADGYIYVVDTLMAGPRGDIYKKMSGLN